MTDLELVIIGAGGHGSELQSYVHDVAAAGERVRLLGFIDEHKPRGASAAATILGGVEALRAISRASGGAALRYITAIGDNAARERCVADVEGLQLGNLAPWTLRHPRTVVGIGVEVGDGTCLAPGSIVTTRVRLGRHCIVNVKASVSHDSVIGDFVNLNPGSTICGHVSVGTGCYIGAGATVLDKVAIGDWTVVGAGAVVVHDLPPGVTAVGVPARIIKQSRAPHG